MNTLGTAAAEAAPAMRAFLLPALRSFALLTVVCGLAYPLLVAATAQAFMPMQAHGSLITSGKRIEGSRLIGQPFSSTKYFWGRPSASNYNGMASSGSNLAPSNPALVSAARERMAALHAADPTNARPIPTDLVLASASGLDPEISPAAADYQIARVARVRGIEPARLRSLIAANTRPRLLGLIGEPGVNVLLLNRALDAVR